jgi:hypothetical protein
MWRVIYLCICFVVGSWLLPEFACMGHAWGNADEFQMLSQLPWRLLLLWDSCFVTRGVMGRTCGRDQSLGKRLRSSDGFVELLAPLGEQADGGYVHHEIGDGGFGSCIMEWPSHGTARFARHPTTDRPAGSIG